MGDEDEDGEWEAPQVENPKCKVGCGEWKRPMKANPDYKGKWYPPKVKNPAYKGEWKPRQIPNPDYVQVENPYKMAAMGAAGFELLTNSGGILFDNVYIGNDVSEANTVRDAVMAPRTEAEKAAVPNEDGPGFFTRMQATILRTLGLEAYAQEPPSWAVWPSVSFPLLLLCWGTLRSSCAVVVPRRRRHRGSVLPPRRRRVATRTCRAECQRCRRLLVTKRPHLRKSLCASARQPRSPRRSLTSRFWMRV